MRITIEVTKTELLALKQDVEIYDEPRLYVNPILLRILKASIEGRN